MTAEPLILHRDIVRPEWVDFNGHMNSGYYLVAFDLATAAFFRFLDIDAAYMARTNFSTFALEGHITYEREVVEGDDLVFQTRLLDHDTKRLHYFHEMMHASRHFLVATNEVITAHIDMSVRRMAPFTPETMARLSTLLERHRHLDRPPQVGRSIGIRRKPDHG